MEKHLLFMWNIHWKEYTWKHAFLFPMRRIKTFEQSMLKELVSSAAGHPCTGLSDTLHLLVLGNLILSGLWSQKRREKKRWIWNDGAWRVAGFVGEDIWLSGTFSQKTAKALAALQGRRNMSKRVLPADRGTLIAFPRFSWTFLHAEA